MQKKAAKNRYGPKYKNCNKNDVNITITYDENPAYKGQVLTNEDKYQYYSIEENKWKTAETNPTTIPVSKMEQYMLDIIMGQKDLNQIHVQY